MNRLSDHMTGKNKKKKNPQKPINQFCRKKQQTDKYLMNLLDWT